MSLDIWLSVKVDTGSDEPYEAMLFDANYTHNVTPMWDKAGVYDALYNSDGVQAGTLIPTLTAGIEAMHADPEAYQALNPPNGWGKYETALGFLERFAIACRTHPKAIVGVSK